MNLEGLKAGATQFAERVRYPTHGDGYSLYRNIAAPGIYMNVGFFLVNLANLIGSKFGFIPDEAGEVIRNYVWPVSNAVGYGSLAFSLPMAYSVLRERKNRISFGESLTVSRVAILPNAAVAKALPELSGEKYYGELHFVGKKLDIQVTQVPNFHRVMREGIKGLSQLVEACEQQDPRLAGINYFLGKSPIVTEELNRFGFRVTEPPPSRTYRIKDPADFLRKLMGRQPFEWLKHRRTMMCVASRNDLLAKKDVIDRVTKRLDKKIIIT